MRILILAPRPPWPPIDGGRIAMSRLAESLAHAGAEVEILALNPRKHRVDPTAAPLPLRAIDIDTSRPLYAATRAMREQMPFLVARFVSDEFRRALDETIRRFRPDVVQIESPFLLPYARQAKSAFIALRSLNVEFRIWEGLAATERNPLRRAALRAVAASLRNYEVRRLDTPDAIVPITRADADELRRLGCTKPIHVAPCGVEAGATSIPEPLTVGFIGSLDFRPNQEAVQWIVSQLWPRISAMLPEARLSIAGSSAPEWLRGSAFVGQVPDATAFMQRMSVMLAPLFAGGGMRIKVLEAMALGKPVVATALGAGGIEVTPGHDIVIAEDAASFADAVVRLLRDSALAAQIGAAARETVRMRYDNDAIGRELLAFYGG